MTNLTLFRKTQEDIETYSSILNEVSEAAMKLGMSETGLNITNAWRKCLKVIEELQDAKKRAKKLGYTSLFKALEALAKFQQSQEKTLLVEEPGVYYPNERVK